MHHDVASRLTCELKRRRDEAARDGRPLEAMSVAELDDVYTRVDSGERRVLHAEQIADLRARIASGQYPTPRQIDVVANELATVLQ